MKITRGQLRRLLREEITRQLREDGHTDVPSAQRAMMTSMENATDILDALAHADGGHNLPTWWMKKVHLAADYLDAARDYLVTKPQTDRRLSEGEGSGGCDCGCGNCD